MPPGPDADQPRTAASPAGSPSAAHGCGSATHPVPTPHEAPGAVRSDKPANSYPGGIRDRARTILVGSTAFGAAVAGRAVTGRVGGACWPHAAHTTIAMQDAKTRMKPCYHGHADVRRHHERTRPVRRVAGTFALANQRET